MPVDSRKHIAAVWCSLLLAASFNPATAYACKDRAYPESFPVEELDQYEHVYVIHVEAVTFSQPREATWYAPPFNFEGRVVMSLKGPRMPGETIQGITTSNEEAHARCPIFLEEGNTYLLMLNGGEVPYALPRYGSLYVWSAWQNESSHGCENESGTWMSYDDRSFAGESL